MPEGFERFSEDFGSFTMLAVLNANLPRDENVGAVSVDDTFLVLINQIKHLRWDILCLMCRWFAGRRTLLSCRRYSRRTIVAIRELTK